MKKSKLSILLLFLVMIIAMSAVSAADADDSSDSDMLSVDEAPVDEVASADVDEIVATDDTEVETDPDDGNNFTSLQTLVDENTSSFTLKHDYVRAEGDNEISITDPLTIVGDGFKIDANGLGGIFKISPGGSLTLVGVTLVNGKSNDGGAIYNNGELTITNCKFSNNTAANNGGAIYNNGISFIISGDGVTTFEDNKAANGAAIYTKTTTSITNTKFDSNIASEKGGAIYSEKELTVSNSEFNTNQVTNDYANGGSQGGAIYASGEKLEIKDSGFTGNIATPGDHGDGAAIYAEVATTTVTGTTFKSNRGFLGGAVYLVGVNQDTFAFDNCTFDDNIALQGGAIFVEEGVMLKINDAIFTDNKADSDRYIQQYNDFGAGAAISAADGSDVTVDVRNSKFIRNTVISGPTENSGLGAAILSTGSVIVDNSEFINNTADKIATIGVYGNANAGTVTVTNSNFTGNKATKGDAAAIYASSAKTSTIDNCKFEENTAVGKGVILANGPADIKNSKFSGNEAVNNSIIYANNKLTLFKNEINTLSSNIVLGENGEVDSLIKVVILDNMTIDENYDESVTITATVTDDSDNFIADIGGFKFVTDGAEVDAAYDAINEIYTGVLTLPGPGIFIVNITYGNKNNLTVETATIKNYRGTFKDLNAKIANNEALQYDFRYTPELGDDIYAGGIEISSDKTINGNNHIIDGNNLARAFNFNDEQVSELNGITFVNCKGDIGGVILVNSDKMLYLTINHCTFENNTATENGGAIYIGTAALTINHCTFENNTATENGGAIYNDEKLTLDNGTFINNNATYAKSIYNGAGATLTLKNNTINTEYAEIVNEGGITSYYATILNGTSPVYVDDDYLELTATVYDDKGNLIYDPDLKFTIDSETEPLTTTAGYEVYNATYTLPTLGYYEVSFADVSGLNVDPIEIVYVPGTFTELQRFIDEANGELNLTHNFTYNAAIDEDNFPNGVLIDEALTINGNGYTISGNESYRIFKVTADNVVLNNIIFADGKVSSYKGGAIYANASSPITLTINNSVFKNNLAQLGGAIFAEKENVLVVDNTLFDENEAIGVEAISIPEYGEVSAASAIYANAAFTLTNSNFTNGQVKHNGGVIHIEVKTASELLIDNCRFENNVANQYGVIYSSNPSDLYGDVDYKLTVKNSKFINNVAKGESGNGRAGAINFLGFKDVTSELIIENTEFIGNNATYGGAIYIKGGNLTVRGSNFTDNKALKDYGGAIYIDEDPSGNVFNPNTVAKIDGSKFTNNNANTNGGAIYIKAGDVTVENSVFDTNKANGQANAIYLNAGSLALSGNTVVGTATEIINNAGTLASTSNSTVLGNGTYDALYTFDLNATLTDDKGNKIFDPNLRFTINGETYSVVPDYDETTGIYNITGYALGFEPTYLVNVSASGDVNAKFGIIKNLVIGTFKDLQYQINNADDELNLTYDFKYNEDIDGAEFADGVKLNKTLTINGNGHEISGNSTARIFYVTSKATLNNITFTGAVVEGDGGAIYATADVAKLTVENSQFTANEANQGGAIYFAGTTLAVENTQFADNVGVDGAAINFNGTTLTVSASNFTDNSAYKNGGAIFINNGAATITGSEFNGNKANGKENAIYLNKGSLSLSDNAINKTAAEIVNKEGTFTSNVNITILDGGIVDAVYGQSIELTATYTDLDGNLIDDVNFKFDVEDAGTIDADYENGVYTATYVAKQVGEKVVTTNLEYSTVTSALLNISKAEVIITIEANETIKRKENQTINITIKDELGNLLNVTIDVYVKNSTGDNNFTASPTTVNGTYSFLFVGSKMDKYEVLVSFGSTEFYKGNAQSKSFEVVQLDTNNTFTELQDLITAYEGTGETLVLPHNFTYDSWVDEDLYEEGILITKDIVIDGNGTAIDASKVCRILNIASGISVTIRNFTFINGNSIDGAAIYTEADSLIISACKFINNDPIWGGALSIGNGTVTVNESSLFENNTAEQGGAIFVDSGASLIVDGVTFRNNTALLGAAIFISSDASLDVTGSVFDDNYAMTIGTIIAFEDSVVTVSDSEFTNNVNVAICIDEGTLTVDATVFDKNIGGYSGAAIFAMNSTVVIEGNSNFTLNKVNSSIPFNDSGYYDVPTNAGGAVSVLGGSLTINGARFEGNTYENADWNLGGAVYVDDATVDINDTEFISNTGFAGGALYLDEVESAVINSSTFIGNTALQGGAISISDGGNVTIENTYFTANKAIGGIDAATPSGIHTQASAGGAIAADTDATLNIIGSTFKDNEATSPGSFGGAIKFSYGTLNIIEGSEFINNSASMYGAVYSGNGATATINGSKFTANKATDGDAGAVYSSSTASLTVDDCTFENNTAAGKGGAILVNKEATIENSVFENNAAASADAVYVSGTLTLKGNKINTEKADVILGDNSKLVDTYINATILGNTTIDITTTKINLTAVVVDDEGNMFIAPGFNFTVTGLDDVPAVFNPDTGLYEAELSIPNETAIYYVSMSYTSDVDAYFTILRNIIGTYTDLQAQIDAAEGELNLTYDFKYDADVDGQEFIDGVLINETITINGNGHKISGNESYRIFDVTADNVVLNDIVFADGKAEFYKGGAIYADAGSPITLTINNSVFENNFAQLGGAIFAEKDNVLVIDNTLFDKNEAVGDVKVAPLYSEVSAASAIYTNAGFTITNSNFTNGHVKHNGGVIFIEVMTASELEIDNCRFEDNTVDWNYGVIYATNPSVDYGNEVDYKLTVKDSKFINNVAKGESGNGRAGAINFLGFKDVNSELIVENTEFIGNNATYGGAIYVKGGNVTIRESNFTDNNALTNFGGAIYIDEDPSGNVFNPNTFVEIEKSRFTNNNANTNGGAIYIKAGDVTVENSVFDGNAANGEANAIYLDTGVLSLSENTINENVAEIVINNGTIITESKSTVLGNDTYNVTSDTYNLEANLIDDKGNRIYDPNFRFVVNDEIFDVAPDYDAATGLYNVTYPIGDERIYVVDAISGSQEGLITEIGILRNIKGTFTDLQIKIKAAEGELNLTYDFTFTDEIDAGLFPNGVVINDTITINGNGAIINGNNTNVIFLISAGEVVLDNVTIANSYSDIGYNAIYATTDLTVANSKFINNTAINNDAVGGAISFQYAGTLTVTNSVFENNEATSSGGAISIQSGSAEDTYLIVEDCTFIGNSAELGAAIASKPTHGVAHVSIVNSTFDEDNAIYLNMLTSAVISDSNITASDATAYGIYNNLGELNLNGNNVSNIIYSNGTITSDVFAVLIDGETVPARLYDNVTPYATLTDADGNAIYDPNFAITVRGETLETSYNASAKLYTAKYTIVKAGPNVVDTTYVADITVGVYDVPKENITNFTIIINPSNKIEYGENATVEVTLLGIGGEGLNVTDLIVVINTTGYPVEIINGTGSFVASLDPANYAATGFFAGNDNYNPAYVTTLFDVLEQNKVLSIDVDDFTIFNQAAVVNITVAYANATPASGIVALNVNGKKYLVDVDGNTSFEINGLPLGEHVVNATLIEEGLYAEVINDDAVIVVKDNPNVEVFASSYWYIYYGEDLFVRIYPVSSEAMLPLNGTATITVYDEYMIPVNVTTVHVNDTAADVWISGLNVGNYDILVEFVSDDGYYSGERILDTEVYSVLVDNLNITVVGEYGQPVIINVTEVSFNGTLLNGTVQYYILSNRSINGTFTVTDGAGLGEITDILKAGNYPLVFMFEDENENYYYIGSISFEVIKATPTIDVNDTEVDYDVYSEIPYAVFGVDGQAIDGSVIATIEMMVPEYGYVSDDSITFAGLNAGTYEVTVKFISDDENYANAEKVIKLNVTQAELIIDVDVTTEDPVFGDDVTANIYVDELVEGDEIEVTVTVMKDGEEYKTFTVPINSAVTEIVFEDYEVGNYNFTIVNENANYAANIAYGEFNISEYPIVFINAGANDTITYGDNLTVVIDPIYTVGTSTLVKGNATIYVYLDDELVQTIENITVNETGATYDIPGLAAGSYELDIYFISDDEYYEGIDGVETTVNKADVSTFIIDTTDAVYGNNAVVNITILGVNDEALNGTIYITLNAEPTDVYNATFTDGNYVYYVPADYDVDTYTAVVYFIEANGNYEDAATYESFKITKATPTIDVNDTKVVYNVYSEIPYDVLGVDGQAVNGSVIATIEMQVPKYGVTSDDSITFAGLNVGTYEVTVKFTSDDENYVNTEKVINLTVAQAPIVITSKVLNESIEYGEAYFIQVNITGLVDGDEVLFDLYVFQDGVCIHNNTFTYSHSKELRCRYFDAGEYTYMLKHNGTDNYQEAVSNGNFTIAPANIEVYVWGDGNVTYGDVYNINLVTDDAWDLRLNVTDALVEIANANGTVYSAVININGSCILPVTVNFPAGNYTINVTVPVQGGNNLGGFDTWNFEVLKASSSVVVDAVPDEIYPGSFVINYTVENATNIMIFVVKSTDLRNPVYTEVIDAFVDHYEGNVTLNDYIAGKYAIFVINNESDIYTLSMDYARFDVLPADPELIIDVSKDNVYGVNVTINVQAPSDATGNVYLYIDGNYVRDGILNETGAVLFSEAVDAGQHSFTVYYEGDNNYNETLYLVPFYVAKATPTLDVNDTNIVYGEFVDIPFIITGVFDEAINGTVIAVRTIAEEPAYVTYDEETGVGSFTYPKLITGEQLVVVKFLSDNDNYNNVEKGIILNVTQAPLAIDSQILNEEEPEYGDVVYFSINVTGLVYDDVIDLNLTVLRNGEYYYGAIIPISEDDVYRFENFDAGEYTYKLSYDGEGDYQAADFEGSFIISPIDLDLEVYANINVTYGDDYYIFIMVDGIDGLIYVENVTVMITGDEVVFNKTFDEIDGSYGLVIPVKFAPGDYEVVIAVPDQGDNYYGETIDYDLTVFKVNLTDKVAVEGSKVTYGENGTVTVYFPTDYLVPVEGTVEVQLVGVDGIYNATVSDGKAIVEIEGLAGNATYAIQSIAYSGDDYFEGFTITDSATVKVAQASSIIWYEYYVSEYPGTADIIYEIENATNVTVFVGYIDTHTVIYNVTTEINEDFHVGKLNLTGLPAGSYYMLIVNAETENYLYDYVEAIFDVDKAAPELVVEVPNVIYYNPADVTVTLSANATGNVTIIINGKEYTAEINDGIATATIDAEYINLYENTVNVIYDGDGNYTMNHNSTTFTAYDNVVTNDTFFIYFDESGVLRDEVLFDELIFMGEFADLGIDHITASGIDITGMDAEVYNIGFVLSDSVLSGMSIGADEAIGDLITAGDFVTLSNLEIYYAVADNESDAIAINVVGSYVDILENEIYFESHAVRDSTKAMAINVEGNNVSIDNNMIVANLTAVRSDWSIYFEYGTMGIDKVHTIRISGSDIELTNNRIGAVINDGISTGGYDSPTIEAVLVIGSRNVLVDNNTIVVADPITPKGIPSYLYALTLTAVDGINVNENKIYLKTEGGVDTKGAAYGIQLASCNVNIFENEITTEGYGPNLGIYVSGVEPSFDEYNSTTGELISSTPNPFYMENFTVNIVSNYIYVKGYSNSSLYGSLVSGIEACAGTICIEDNEIWARNQGGYVEGATVYGVSYVQTYGTYVPSFDIQGNWMRVWGDYAVGIVNDAEAIVLDNFLITPVTFGDESVAANENLSVVERNYPAYLNITTSADDVTVDSPVIVNVYTNVLFTGNVTLYVDEKEYNVSVVDGVGSFAVEALAAADYDYSIEYIGYDEYMYDDFVSEVAYGNFTVNKYVTEINVITGDLIVDEELAVTVSIQHLNGTIAISVDGAASEVTMEDGIYNFTIPRTGMTAGNHTITVIVMNNDKYCDDILDYNFTVEKAENYTFDVNLTLDEINFGENASFNVTLPEDANGVLLVNVNNYTTWADVVNGTANVTVPANAFVTGDNTITVSYGDDKYADVNATAVIKVDRIPGKLLAYAPNINIDDNATVYVYIPTYTNGTVLVELLGDFYPVDINNSNGHADIEGLGEGNYTAYVYFFDDSVYLNNSTIVEFSVIKVVISPEEAFNITTPENATAPVITVQLPDDATGFLLLDIDGKQTHVALENGTATIAVPNNLLEGTYNATVTYTGDDKYAPITTTQEINVTSNVPDSALTIPDSAKSDAPTTYSISLPSDAGGVLEVDVDGTKYAAALNKGSASVTVPALPAGNHKVTVSYTGDGNYSPVLKETSLSVSNPVFKLTNNKDVSVIYSGKGTYKVLVLREGKAVGAGQAVTIKYNGKTSTVKTDKNGYATFNINTKVKVKTYTITASYKGITVKNKVKVTHVIKAKNKKVKKSKKVNKVKITLKKVNGKYLKKVKVTIKFKGKKYKVKTNKKGKATWKVKKSMLKKTKVGKKYKYKVTYGKDVVSKKLKIKK